MIIASSLSYPREMTPGHKSAEESYNIDTYNLAIIGVSLGRVAENQAVEIRIVAEWIQIMIVLGPNTEIRLQVERPLERLESQIN